MYIGPITTHGDHTKFGMLVYESAERIPEYVLDTVEVIDPVAIIDDCTAGVRSDHVGVACVVTRGKRAARQKKQGNILHSVLLVIEVKA